MSTRDEAMVWAVRYFGDPDEKPEDYAEFADALIAEGWRKMPSEEELESALAVGLYKHILNDGTRGQELHRLQVREILALMDGGSA